MLKPIVLAMCLALSGCSAFLKAAPTILDATADVIDRELARAADEQQQADLLAARAVLAEVRRERALAEDASRRAEEAAQRSEEAAVVAAAGAQEAQAMQRYVGAKVRLAAALRVALRLK